MRHNSCAPIFDCASTVQLDKLPTGPDVPDEVYVLVEIPANGPGIKLELEKASGALLVDRFRANRLPASRSAHDDLYCFFNSSSVLSNAVTLKGFCSVAWTPIKRAEAR